MGRRLRTHLHLLYPTVKDKVLRNQCSLAYQERHHLIYGESVLTGRSRNVPELHVWSYLDARYCVGS